MRNRAGRKDRQRRKEERKQNFGKTNIMEWKVEWPSKKEKGLPHKCVGAGDGSRRALPWTCPQKPEHILQGPHPLSEGSQERREPVFHSSQVNPQHSQFVGELLGQSSGVPRAAGPGLTLASCHTLRSGGVSQPLMLSPRWSC